MTSPLRKKHPITALNIPETNDRLAPEFSGVENASSANDQAPMANAVVVLEARVTHEASATNEFRATEVRISHFKKYRSGKVALYSVAAFAAAMFLNGVSVARADSDSVSNTNNITPGTRLVWHPVRPLRPDDGAAPLPSDTKSKSSDAATKSFDNTAKSDTAKPSDKKHSDSAANTINDDAPMPPSKEHSPSLASVKAVHRSGITPVAYDDDDSSDATPNKSKVQLTGTPGSVSGSASSLALTDPFGDNLPSVKSSHRIAMTPPEEIDTLPPPQNSPQMRIEPVQQDPAELEPPEPLRSGLPKRTVNTYQTQIPGPPAPAAGTPDLLPNNNFGNGEPQLPLQSQRNPAVACREEYDQIKALTLNKLSIDIIPPGNNAKGDQVPFECSLSTDQFTPRCWPGTTYTWKASALCHKPLYFEDEHLERYGHSWGPYGFEYAQSCVHFFGDLAVLPYMVGVYTPCECVYDLGVYRPGDCAPWICDPFPLSCRGLVTGGVGYGAIALLFP